MQIEVYQTSISRRALLSINALLYLFIFFFDSDCILFYFFLSVRCASKVYRLFSAFVLFKHSLYTLRLVLQYVWVTECSFIALASWYSWNIRVT